MTPTIKSAKRRRGINLDCKQDAAAFPEALVGVATNDGMMHDAA